jgi:hypothetical protein
MSLHAIFNALHRTSDMSENDIHKATPASPSKARVALGIFLLVAALYALSSPGRIDIIDGQARFDVAYNWLHAGKPLITDGWIKPFMAVRGRDNLPFSYYGAPASLLAMPLMAFGSPFDDAGFGTSQFLFSLTSPLLGAGIAAVLFLFYVELGFSVNRALTWAMISAFATMLWPLSGSTFDNAQHAFFAVCGAYLAFLSARRNSYALAMAGGLMGAILLLYQEYFLLIIPALAMATLRWPARATLLTDVREFLTAAWKGPGEARASCVRFLLCTGTAVVIAFAFSCWYNNLRFGSPFDDGKLTFSARRGFPMFGNPIAGFGTLILSPGKSVFLYSPTLILAVIGWRRLYREQRALALGIATASISLVLFISCISFAGGDWCWGPRYLGVVVALFALALPFVWIPGNRIISLVVALSFCVQLMAVSVENQRFFFERGLKDFFWAEDPWFYFKHSALLARVGETLSLHDPPPPTADRFNSIPEPDWTTYTILGPDPRTPRSQAPQWMTKYKIYYLPKPWPLWMSWIPPQSRPVNLRAWLCGSGGTLLLALIALFPLYNGSRRNEVLAASRFAHEADAL